MDSLPGDVWAIICSSLALRDILRLGQTSRRLSHVVAARRLLETRINSAFNCADDEEVSVHECRNCGWSQDGYQEKCERIFLLPGNRVVATAFALQQPWGEAPLPDKWRFFEMAGHYTTDDIPGTLVISWTASRVVSFDTKTLGLRCRQRHLLARVEHVRHDDPKPRLFKIDHFNAYGKQFYRPAHSWPIWLDFRPMCCYHEVAKFGGETSALVSPHLAHVSLSKLQLLAFAKLFEELSQVL